mgnify:CR=1 FL=1
MTWLLEPLAFDFFRSALLGAALAGAVTALIGTYVVLRRMVFAGEALSHAVLPGVALAHVLGGNIFAGGFIAAALTGLAVGALSRHRHLKEDTAIGILLAGTLALGIAIMSSVRSYTVDLASFLFGDVLAVGPDGLALLAAVGVLVTFALVLFNRQWTLLAFDATYAAAAGVPAAALHYAMMLLLALTVIAAMQAVGVLLVLAMIVTPPATARLLTRRVPAMAAGSVLLGVFSSVTGLYASYYLDVASGAAIVLVSVLLFALAYLFAPGHGVLSGRRRAALPPPSPSPPPSGSQA